MTQRVPPKRILIIGGTRFSGLYLQKELHSRGHEVVLYNRGKTANKQLPNEEYENFTKRAVEVKTIVGDRKSEEVIRETLGNEKFDAVFDMNARELSDTKPLADLFNGKVEHYVFMSSAGVYLKSDQMPHRETDETDPKSRHKGKFESEEYLKKIGIPFTSIRPTYIYGPLNYNPLEEWFFERLDQDRPIIIPGHGQHLTGLGHVKDLAVAMANVIGNEKAKGQIYNIQDSKAITFDGIAKACAEAMGKDPSAVVIKHYDPKKFDFGKKKAFPMRPQHFFAGISKAMKDLDWAPSYSTLEGLKDSYLNDFAHKKKAEGLKNDFECDDKVLGH
eukprot:CAMPEP_0171457270 /NCGR_PEP_ID=MMETSP0945-20130129/3416_1 /TAXON_ID=109269 /ORGANISM="Vaucheria litorea, Strain CCMP2940" /LENGTH=331 /DNA_ID=CAMNT_0011982845 /DNA_START=75 /DNA_END=1070 /DNA_ORIENTATION=+